MSDATALPTTTADPESLALTGCRLFRRSEIAHLERPVPWIWHGYLARHSLTLLTGQWKIGKTTLLTALLARMGYGSELAGRPVSPGRAEMARDSPGLRRALSPPSGRTRLRRRFATPAASDLRALAVFARCARERPTVHRHRRRWTFGGDVHDRSHATSSTAMPQLPLPSAGRLSSFSW